MTQKVLGNASKGKLFVISAPGGTGKTRLIHYMVEYAKPIKKECQVCALTGCATLLLNCDARTIHSWSGIRLANGPKYRIVEKVLKNKKLKPVWRKTNILIVEVSFTFIACNKKHFSSVI